MNLDDQYNPAHKMALNLQGKYHDFVSKGPQAYNPQATTLQHEIHYLVGEIENKKDPRELEHRIKVIEREIRDAQIHGDDIMHNDHLLDLQKHFEQLRQQVHRFDHH